MAGKVPQPWFRKSTQSWYVCIGGRQLPLGKERDEAFRKFHSLMADHRPDLVGADPELRVAQLVSLYLADAQRRLKKTTLRITKAFLDSFTAQFGKLRVREVKRLHVEAWVRANPGWAGTTENLAKTRLVTMFNFGVDQVLIARNPIKGIRKPPQRSRGNQTLITPEQHRLLVENAEPCFRDVLIALYETGARPGEVTNVSAAEFDAERGIWMLTQHKTAHKGEPRVIFRTPTVVDICNRLAQKYPTGPLFRTQRGTPYGWCGLSKRISWLRDRLGLPKTITVYGYRHTFATDALAKGVPEASVAGLLGHRSTSMLHKHYSHLGGCAKTLQTALEEFRLSEE